MLYEVELSLSNTATIGYKWSAKGKQPQIQCKQRKRERQTGLGSLNYDMGQIKISFAQKGNSNTFKKHLKKVLFQYRNMAKIIMVLDNVACHYANRIKAWLAKHPKLELFFLPPYSPDLNAVEKAWWYMRKKTIRNRSVKSLKERKVLFWKMFSHFLKSNEELKIVCEINY